ncbi:MAG: zinc ribbon domain-containing protein [Actinobacteria bacterium]|nr:MAG: zinc ribbon domain-containing protein [Actinomycetota bacterium]
MRSVASSVWSEAVVPTYELRCADCGNRFERFLLRLIRESDKVCPVCESQNVSAGVGGGILGRTSSEAASCGSVGGFG